MKYLKKFDQHTNYETFMDSQDLIYPNVSYCVDRNEVHFNPDPLNGHKYVDLGLPSGTLWATTNIGAYSPEEYGLYFAWGETEGYPEIYKQFTWADYKFNPSGDGTTMTKYNSTDNNVQLDLEDDAAYVNWGENQCMPTKTQFQELLNTSNCTNEWVTNYNNSGINGRLFTSLNNWEELFFPAAGYYNNGSRSKVSTNCDYWSSIVGAADITKGKSFTGTNASANVGDGGQYRCYGFSIRPVIYIEPLA